MKVAFDNTELARLPESPQIQGDVIAINTKVDNLDIRITLTVAALQDGSLQIDLISATAEGLNPFGLVRTKAESTIIAALSTYGDAGMNNGTVNFKFKELPSGGQWNFIGASINGVNVSFELEFVSGLS